MKLFIGLLLFLYSSTTSQVFISTEWKLHVRTYTPSKLANSLNMYDSRKGSKYADVCLQCVNASKPLTFALVRYRRLPVWSPSANAPSACIRLRRSRSLAMWHTLLKALNRLYLLTFALLCFACQCGRGLTAVSGRERRLAPSMMVWLWLGKMNIFFHYSPEA